MKKYAKIIALILGIIYSISQIYDVFMTYKSNLKRIVDEILEFNFLLIGQILLLFGVVLVVTSILVFVIKRIFKIKRPKRDALDYIAEMLLSEDQLDNSEPKHKRRIMKFNILNFAIYVIVFGICLTLGIKIFNKVFNNDEPKDLALNEQIVPSILNLGRKISIEFQLQDNLMIDNKCFTFENSETKSTCAKALLSK